MTALLIFDPTFHRLKSQLVDIMPGLEAVLIREDGSFYAPEGRQTSPEILWLDGDLMGSPALKGLLAQGLPPSIRWTHSSAVGLDHPFFDGARARGVRITNSHASAPAIADFLLAAVLDQLRQGDTLRSAQSERRWQPITIREMGDMRWLIIGFGAIGQEVARRVRAFGADVTAIQRSDAPHSLASVTASLDAVPELLPQADIVLLSLPVTERTRSMVDAAFLDRMAADSILVNVARGALIDEVALIDALDRGRPALAILDVFDQEPLPADSALWGHPRVRVSAHTSYNGSGVAQRNDALFLDNLARFAAGTPLLNESWPT